MMTDRAFGGAGLANKVRIRMPRLGGEVMLNSDLIFLAGAPIVVLAWEQRPFGNYPAVTVHLDPMYLHKANLPDAEYLYELPIEDPRSGAAFGLGSERPQMMGQSSEPMPDDVRQAFRDAINLYADWKFGRPRRPVSFRRLQKISLGGVCDLVLSYRNEPLPADVQYELLNLIDEIRINPKLRLTYAAGAQYLLRLIDNQTQKQAAAKRTRALPHKSRAVLSGKPTALNESYPTMVTGR
jgi:hypothetical protein